MNRYYLKSNGEDVYFSLWDKNNHSGPVLGKLVYASTANNSELYDVTLESFCGTEIASFSLSKNSLSYWSLGFKYAIRNYVINYSQSDRSSDIKFVGKDLSIWRYKRNEDRYEHIDYLIDRKNKE